MIVHGAGSFRERIDRILGPQRLWLHVLLFLVTFFTTSAAGVAWRGDADVFDLANLPQGFEYASLLLLFLSAHEFGHFIAARIHGVDATLPFYIPFPGFAFGSINFGTFGAVIRTRSRVDRNSAMFDIGVAGPIAGFIVCLGVLAVGLHTLPGIEYLQGIHPGYPNIPHAGTMELSFGPTLLFSLMQQLFANPNGYMPPMTEVYHYPMLCVGWFGLFVTSLNLLPVGQLDGGHLTYTMFGPRVHRYLGYFTALTLFVVALPETILSFAGDNPWTHWLNTVTVHGGGTWIVWALITSLVIRFKHPATDLVQLTTGRKIIGYLAILILILSFTPAPLMVN